MIKNLKITFYKENSSKYHTIINELLADCDKEMFVLVGNSDGYNVTTELHNTVWFNLQPKEMIRVMHGVFVGSVKKKSEMVLIMYCPSTVDAAEICSSVGYVIERMNIKIIIVVDSDFRDEFYKYLVEGE